MTQKPEARESQVVDQTLQLNETLSQHERQKGFRMKLRGGSTRDGVGKETKRYKRKKSSKNSTKKQQLKNCKNL